MTTVQALLVGGACGFILGSIFWMILGISLGILQEGITDALKQQLEIENQENKENG